MKKKLERYMRDVTLNIRREEELVMNRRGFIASAFAFVGLAFAASLPFAVRARAGGNKLKAEQVMKIADPEQLAVGDSIAFHYPDESRPAILVRTTERDYRSYFIKCTHLQCPVYWDKPSGKLLCPCHNGIFAVEDGSVLAGPPPRPLPAIELDYRKDGIYAVGVREELAH